MGFIPAFNQLNPPDLCHRRSIVGTLIKRFVQILTELEFGTRKSGLKSLLVYDLFKTSRISQHGIYPCF